MIIYWIACLLSICIAFLVKPKKCESSEVLRAILIRLEIPPKWKGNPFKIKRAKKKELYNWIVALVTSLPLLILSSLREDIGKDYVAYETIFRDIASRRGSAHQYELLYSLLNKLVSGAGFQFQALIFVTSLIFCLLVFKSIQEYSEISELSIFLLLGMTFYFQSTNIIRNMIACAICMYALRFVQNKQLLPFAAAVVIAVGFHISAIIFFPVFFVPQKPLKPFTYGAAIAVVALGVGAVGRYITSYILQLGTAFNNGYYLTYFSTNDEARFGWISFLINLSLFVWAYVFTDKEDKLTGLLLNLQFLTLLLSMMNGSFPLINRIRFYYALPCILLVPRVIAGKQMKKYGNGFQAINIVVIVTLFLGYCWYIEGVLNESGCIPYHTAL